MELKPCPYCGADARMWGIGNTIWVGCRYNDCVETHICTTEEEAAGIWNSRAETPEAAELAGLKDEIEAGKLVRVDCLGCKHNRFYSAVGFRKSKCAECARNAYSDWNDQYERELAAEQEGQNG